MHWCIRFQKALANCSSASLAFSQTDTDKMEKTVIVGSIRDVISVWIWEQFLFSIGCLVLLQRHRK